MIAEMFRTITGAMFRSLKTILAPLLSGGVWGWALLIFFSGCNLFIEDEEDQQGFKSVPQHTGEGYDAPVTVEQGDATVTYQYNDNVRVLTGEVLQYIRHVEYDHTTVLCEVHFDANTPERLLPVPGEILVSTEVGTFPMGINHRVESRYEDDGVIKCLCGFSKLEETFKQLEIDGHLNMGHEDYFVEAENPEAPQGDEAPSDTRAEFDVDGVKVSINDKGVSLTFPLAPPAGFKFTGAKVAPTLTMDKDKNYVRIGFGLDFTNFSLSNMKFSFTQEVEFRTDITLEGEADFSQSIAKFHPLKGHVVTIGPVLLVFFVDIDVVLSASTTASVSQSVWKHKKKVIDIDLKNLTCKARPTEDVKNDPWTVKGMFKGKVGPQVDITFGMGIYGRVLTVNLIPSIFFGIEATLPPLTNAVQEAYELVKQSGADLKLTLELKISVILNLSLNDIFGIDLRNTKKALREVERIAKTDNEIYKKLDEAQQNASTDDDNKLGPEFPLGSWDLWIRHWPWYPVIDDNSFKIENIFSYLTETSTFKGEFKINKEGLLSSLMGRHYVPALRITRGKNYQGVIFPEEGGMEARVESGKTYHFKIPATEDNKTYTATPCYFLYPVKENDPEALDKGLNFNATSPSVHIDDVSVVYMKDEFSEEGNIFNDKGQSYRHKYTYHIETRISVYGLENMAFWSVREDRSNTLYRSNRHNAEKQRDGTYIYRWDVTIYANLDDYATKLTFISNAHNKNGDVLKPGNTYVIRCHSSGTYDIVDDGEGFSLSGLKIPEISRE